MHPYRYKSEDDVNRGQLAQYFYALARSPSREHQRLCAAAAARDELFDRAMSSIARASCSCRCAFSGFPFEWRIRAHSRCCAGVIRKGQGGSSINASLPLGLRDPRRKPRNPADRRVERVSEHHGLPILEVGVPDLTGHLADKAGDHG